MSLSQLALGLATDNGKPYYSGLHKEGVYFCLTTISLEEAIPGWSASARGLCFPRRSARGFLYHASQMVAAFLGFKFAFKGEGKR